MSSIKDTIRSLTPNFALDRFRKYKKKQVNKNLKSQKAAGKSLTKEKLINDFKNIGIQYGDTVLAHTSMSKLGYLEDGASTFIDALLEVIGENGNLFMPSSPNDDLQLNYAKNNPIFNVQTAPSRLGKITEVFRQYPGVIRSFCPTEPVCGIGPAAKDILKDHHLDTTPYDVNSPFRKINKLNAKIVYIGCTLDNAGTSLHTLEDAVDFPYPVYAEKLFAFKVLNGVEELKIHRRVHNPTWSAKRKCDGLIPGFIEAGVCKKGKIGNADTLIFNSTQMFDWMVKNFEENRISMYFPKGEMID